MLLAPVLTALVSALASVLLPELLKAPSGWSLRVPGWLGFIRLAYVRAAGAAVFGIAAPTAIGLSVSNDPHHDMTYIVWYGVAVLGLVAVIAATVVIDRRSLSATKRPQQGPGTVSPAPAIAVSERAPDAPGAPPPADPASLADQIDSLMREGIDLVDGLSVPVEPEQKPNGTWEVSGGGAPAEWQEKADGFRARAWELLSQGRPALLMDYRDACNHFLQKQRDAQAPRSDQNLARDTRSTAKKVLDFATAERSGPALEVEACLEGLSAARHRLG